MTNAVEKISAEGDVTSLVVASSLNITANVQEDGAPVEGVTVNWSVSGGVLNALTSDTDGLGNAVTTLTAGAVAGAVTVTATTTDDSNEQTLSLTSYEAADDKLVQLETDVGNLPNDIGYAQVGFYATVTATVLDSNSEMPAPNVNVAWSVTDDAGKDIAAFVTLTPVDGKIATNAQGIAKVEVVIAKELKAPVPASIKVVARVAGKASDTVLPIRVDPLEKLNPPPIIFGASAKDDYKIDKYDIANGVQGVISPTNVNTSYAFYWGFGLPKVRTVETTGQVLMYNIKEDFEDAFSVGQHPSLYINYDNSINPTYSKSVPVNVVVVSETFPTLLKPSIAKAEDGLLNVADVVTDVPMVVQYPMEKGDIISFYWAVLDNRNNEVIPLTNFNESFEVTTEGVLRHTFNVPTAKFYPTEYGVDGTGRAFYTVIRGNETLLSFENTPRVDTRAP